MAPHTPQRSQPPRETRGGPRSPSNTRGAPGNPGRSSITLQHSGRVGKPGAVLDQPQHSGRPGKPGAVLDHPPTLGAPRETRGGPRSPPTLGAPRETRGGPRSPSNTRGAPGNPGRSSITPTLGAPRETRGGPRSPSNTRGAPLETRGAPRLPGRRLADLAAGGDGLVDVEQHDLTAVVVRAHHQDLGDERADLLGREIDDGDHPPADEVGGGVVRGDLGARALDPQLGAEVDPEAVGWLARLREIPGVGDDTDAHVDLRKVRPGDGHGARRAPSGSEPSVVPG